MPLKIMVPARELMELTNESLDLEAVNRCSRCDRTPADFFESHRLKLNIGHRSTHLLGKKFSFSKKYVLKIRVCESCYQSDFLTHPEALKDDKTSLGRVSKAQSLAWTAGSLLAGVGFLLLTPLVPDLPGLQSLKVAWRLPVIAGVLVLLLAWLYQRKQQGIVLSQLEKNTPHFQPHPRAIVESRIVSSSNTLDEIALGITFENQAWAAETAGIYHLKTENLDEETNPEKNPDERGVA
jgi:hypothetical protein